MQTVADKIIPKSKTEPGGELARHSSRSKSPQKARNKGKRIAGSLQSIINNHLLDLGLPGYRTSIETDVETETTAPTRRQTEFLVEAVRCEMEETENEKEREYWMDQIRSFVSSTEVSPQPALSNILVRCINLIEQEQDINFGDLVKSAYSVEDKLDLCNNLLNTLEDAPFEFNDNDRSVSQAAERPSLDNTNLSPMHNFFLSPDAARLAPTGTPSERFDDRRNDLRRMSHVVTSYLIRQQKKSVRSTESGEEVHSKAKDITTILSEISVAKRSIILSGLKEQIERQKQEIIDTLILMVSKIPFNKDDYKAKKHVYMYKPSIKEHEALKLAPSERTMRDVGLVQNIINHIPMFFGQGEEMKKHIAKTCTLIEAAQGEVVFRSKIAQDDVFFIFSGTVVLTAYQPDQAQMDFEIMVTGQLQSGTTMGELSRRAGETSLRHDFNGIAISEKADVIHFRRDDVHDAMAAEYLHKQQLKAELIRNHAFVKYCNITRSEEEWNAIFDGSHHIECAAGDIIAGDYQDTEHVYLVVKGRAIATRLIKMLRYQAKQGHSLELYDIERSRNKYLSPGETIEVVLLQITSFEENNFFGVGEAMRGTWMLAGDICDIIAIPRQLFKEVELREAKFDLSKHIPSDKKAFRLYLDGLRSNEFLHVERERVRQKMLSKNIPPIKTVPQFAVRGAISAKVNNYEQVQRERKRYKQKPMSVYKEI